MKRGFTQGMRDEFQAQVLDKKQWTQEGARALLRRMHDNFHSSGCVFFLRVFVFVENENVLKNFVRCWNG